MPAVKMRITGWEIHLEYTNDDSTEKIIFTFIFSIIIDL